MQIHEVKRDTEKLLYFELLKNVAIKIYHILVVISIIYLFLFGIELFSISLGLLGETILSQIVEATANPFVGLFIGLLFTAIIQSSSTTTSLVVTMVGSGALSVQEALPIIIGANIGTTVTSTIVSLGFIAKKKLFKRAIAAATVHDFFNILVASLFFPLEYFTNFLSFLSEKIGKTVFVIANNYDLFPFTLHSFIKPTTLFIENLFFGMPLVVLVLAVLTIFTAIRFFIAFIQNIWIKDVRSKLEYYLFGSHFHSLFSGFWITSIIQSSSITTSFVVPLVATNRITLQKAFAFIMGANIGTTFTAVFAALFKSEAALIVAFAHVLFNVLGSLFFLIPFVNQIPIWLATRLGILTAKNRLYGLLYIVITFFFLPFILIYLSLWIAK